MGKRGVLRVGKKGRVKSWKKEGRVRGGEKGEIRMVEKGNG